MLGVGDGDAELLELGVPDCVGVGLQTALIAVRANEGYNPREDHEAPPSRDMKEPVTDPRGARAGGAEALVPTTKHQARAAPDPATKTTRYTADGPSMAAST